MEKYIVVMKIYFLEISLYNTYNQHNLYQNYSPKRVMYQQGKKYQNVQCQQSNGQLVVQHLVKELHSALLHKGTLGKQLGFGELQNQAMLYNGIEESLSARRYQFPSIY